MLMLGDLGACPPRKFCKIGALGLHFRGIFLMKINEVPVLFCKINEDVHYSVMQP